MKSILIVLALFLISSSCFKSYKIEITTDYIINEYWSTASTNFFEIEKMKIKQDSILNIFQPGFEEVSNNWNIVKKLETDNTFIYHYRSNSPSNIIGDTIYFNKWNQGSWAVDARMKGKSLGTTFETIGNLQRDSWYKFSNLRSAQFYVYVYVDNGKVYRFDQNLSNF